MSVGIGETVIARMVTGLAAEGGASVVGCWVGIDVADSVEDASVGVAVAVVDSGVLRGGGGGMMFVGAGVIGLGSAVAATDVGVAAGIGAWSEQATKAMRIGTTAHFGSLVSRVLLGS